MVVSASDVYRLTLTIDSTDPIETARVLAEIADSLAQRGFESDLYRAESRGIVRVQKWSLHGGGSMRLVDVKPKQIDEPLDAKYAIARERNNLQRVNDRLERVAWAKEKSWIVRAYRRALYTITK